MQPLAKDFKCEKEVRRHVTIFFYSLTSYDLQKKREFAAQVVCLLGFSCERFVGEQ